ncbi:MAG: choice-of-anchor D domain-containing protein [Ignavibacteriaceae bacterium]|nr:choice-of-anchor D domain-containing protein [Ignavibacteriaceae bacterium]
MKRVFISFLFLFSSLSYSQTLVQTVDLPSGTYWNSGYGMVYQDAKYWISSSSSSTGRGIFYAVNSSGAQVDQLNINYPSMRASQGLAFDGTNFWYVERKISKCDIFKVAPDGSVLDSITSSQLFGGNWYMGGAAWDGTGLWVSIYYPNPSAALYKIDVNTKTVVDTISVFGTQPQGIAVKGDTLFYVMDGFEGDDERVYALNLANEDTLFSFHVPETPGSRQNPRGLAWDETFFWLLAEPVGASSGRQLFKYDLGGSGTPGINIPITNVFFPNTTVGNTSIYDLTIYSNGTTTLTVDSIKIAGNGFTYDPISFPLQIPSGNSSDVTLNFTPTDYAVYNGIINIYSNDPVDPVVQVSLKGQGVLSGARIGLTATSHNFGNVWVGEGITYWDFSIFNMGDQNLDVTNLQLFVPEFSVESPSLPFQIFPTDTIDLRAYFYPTQVVTYEDTLKISSNDSTNPVAGVFLEGAGVFNFYNHGYTFWQYQVPPHPNSTSASPRIEALKPINDITGDGIQDVVISTENYWTMCLDGAASGTSFPIWIFTTYMGSNNTGSIGANFEYGVQDAMQIANDLNGDGFNDVILAVGGGNEHVYVLDGTNGEIIWQYGDDINYSLGDFEAVDVQRDFNGDNINDVLAIADGNSAGTGYKRAFLFDGTNGNVIWEHFYPGPNPSFGKTIVSIDDFTGDNIPEVAIAYGNNGSTNQAVRTLNGSNGQEIWTREMIEYEPKELIALPLPGGGTDIIAAEYFNRIHRLDGMSGDITWTYPLGGSAGVIQLNLIEDIDSDQIPDVLIASFAGNGINCLSGGSGTQLWSWQMDFQFGVTAIPDIDNDGGEDVVVGSRDQYLYCINGKGDSVIFQNQFSDWLYSVNVMASIDGNISYEILAGTRDGVVASLSGGTDTVTTVGTSQEIPTDYVLYQNYPNPFNPNTIIEFRIPLVGLVNLKIYDILGREITTLVNEEMQAGNYKIDFDASTLASGIYFYTLQAGDFVATKKMILLK